MDPFEVSQKPCSGRLRSGCCREPGRFSVTLEGVFPGLVFVGVILFIAVQCQPRTNFRVEDDQFSGMRNLEQIRCEEMDRFEVSPHFAGRREDRGGRVRTGIA